MIRHHQDIERAGQRAAPLNTQDARRKTLRAFTLVEVLVVIAILLVLFNLLMVPMMMGLKLTSSTRRAVEAQDRARIASEQMKKDVARAMLAYVYPAVSPAAYISGWPNEFVTSRLDLIMPKTDSEGKPIQPQTPDPNVIRYYVAPVRNSVGVTDGWPKYWNPFQEPDVGVPPASGTEPRLYVFYRVRFNLDRLQTDPTYLFYGSDPWKMDFYDDPAPSPVTFGAQPVSYSFWWRKMSNALTPVESADAALYAWQPGTGPQEELRPLEKQLPTGEWVAAPGFSALPARREKEQLVPNDKGEPTTYFASLSLWSEWPPPIISLSNGNPPAGQEFWTVDLTNGVLDFTLSRTEYFDGEGALVKSSPPDPNDTIPPDCDLLQIANNVYEVLLKKDDGTDALPGQDRGGPTFVSAYGLGPLSHQIGDPIADFVVLPGSEKVQVIDSSGNISDYTRSTESDPALIEQNSYYVDYESGRITFTQGFNDPAAGPTKDIIAQFQYRRNVLREQDAVIGLLKKVAGSDDNVLATYSSLALVDVRLIIASYSQSKVPTDEFRLASRLEVGNAPR